MRKKYLSALLFGALLFASAGTFTSCKDYDDDINNLQEQINTVVSDLNSLKSQIGDKGVSSVTFDEATGVLTVVDADGTHTYTIKTSAGEVADIKVTIDGQNLVVNGETVGKVGDTVTINEDGYLCINGEATAIKAGKYAILENVSDNTYTISLPDKDGNMQTIQLLRAIPTNLQILVGNLTTTENVALFTEGRTLETPATDAKLAIFEKTTTQSNHGIYWGTATEDVDWAGVKKGDLLIGQQNYLEVTVLPATTELDTQNLQLVDSEGNVAPVKVSASPVNGVLANSGSRSKDTKGQWKLQVTMTEDVTKDNMGKAFTTKNEDNQDKNKLYALSVNGTVLTAYVFVIDTQENALGTSTPISFDEDKVEVEGMPMLKVHNLTTADGTEISTTFAPGKQGPTAASLDLNKSYSLSYVDPQISNYKFSIVEADINDADAYGITLENNVITASDDAAGKTIRLKCSILGVNGKKVDADNSKFICLTFGNTKADAEEITGVSYELPATALTDEYIDIDLGSTFSGLTSAEAVSLTDFAWNVDADKFLVKRANLSGAIKFYENESEANKGNEITISGSAADKAANIKKIKLARISLASAADLNTAAAETGKRTLTLTLKAGANEVKKVKVPVTVTAPKFDDLFVKSGAWEDNVVTFRLDKDGKADMLSAYRTETGVLSATNELTVTFGKINNESSVQGVDADQNKAFVTDGSFTIASAVITNNGALNTISADATYIINRFEKIKVESGDFTMKFITPLDGSSIVNYINDQAVALSIEGNSCKFNPYALDGDNKKQGIALYLNSTNYVIVTQSNGDRPNQMALAQANWSCKFDSKAGDNATATIGTNGSITITGLATGEYDTVLTLSYKAVTVGGKVVYTQIPVTIHVVNK